MFGRNSLLFKGKYFTVYRALLATLFNFKGCYDVVKGYRYDGTRCRNGYRGRPISTGFPLRPNDLYEL